MQGVRRFDLASALFWPTTSISRITETYMVKIGLDNPESGWAYAHLSDGIKELVVTAPFSPVDVLRDFVDAVQSLQTVEMAHCCWSQEPGELHWRLLRKNDDLEVEILSFPDTSIPGRHRGDPISIFKAHTSWLRFAREVLSSLESIKTNLGLEGYERECRHPYPNEAYEKLQNAIHERR
jgi:hypothetical protein